MLCVIVIGMAIGVVSIVDIVMFIDIVIVIVRVNVYCLNVCWLLCIVYG